MDPLKYQVTLPEDKAFIDSAIEMEYLRPKYDDDVRERGIRESFTWADCPTRDELFTRMRSTRFDSVEFVRELDGSQPTLAVVATTPQHRRNLIVLLQQLEVFGATKIMESTKKDKTFSLAGVLTYLICGYQPEAITERPVIRRANAT